MHVGIPSTGVFRTVRLRARKGIAPRTLQLPRAGRRAESAVSRLRSCTALTVITFSFTLVAAALVPI